jgi:hypothetical protein
LFCNVKTSKENCENVVYPPSKPVKRNKLKESVLCSPIETRIPNRKEPSTFTRRVPNWPIVYRLMMEFVPYLNIEPIPPPRNTKNNLLNTCLP